MPEFFLELFSEEIPARMQAGASDELARVCEPMLTQLKMTDLRTFHGPRRIALVATVKAEKPGGTTEVRGPREGAPEAAVSGFLGKYKASRDELVIESGFYLLRRHEAALPAADLIASSLPAALLKFSWPKSMRWGQSDDFTWVRPLRRMVCLLGGKVVPIKLGPVTAGNETEGHRFMAPGAFVVSSAKDWQDKLRERMVIADQAERRALVISGLAEVAAKAGLTVVEDAGLVDEVTGLVEWPVALLGKIDADFMDLPPEVRELSMKVNQRYFALRDNSGRPAPFFAFAANIEATDGGAAIIAGNERVLRARLSDARHFWDLDRKIPLDALLPKLAKITFHAKIGTQLERSERISALAEKIALALGADASAAAAAKTAGRLCKADLVTGMVGEFPELQGIMGGYYAENMMREPDGSIIGSAIKTHYQPKGPSDAVPTGIVAVSVALADKLDTLTEFFRIGEKPTGSGDPYALRRAALGVIRTVLENRLSSFDIAGLTFDVPDLYGFILERLRVKLKSEGKRFDILDAALAFVAEGNLLFVMERADALTKFITTENGANLLSGYRRAANILKIEEAKDGPHTGTPNRALYIEKAEKDLAEALDLLVRTAVREIAERRYGEAMRCMSDLRKFVDAFFDQVTVNDPVPQIRLNRLQLLAQLRDTMDQIADFSKIEG
jgi:glycyl-tRNA synthetase beta chain